MKGTGVALLLLFLYKELEDVLVFIENQPMERRVPAGIAL